MTKEQKKYLHESMLKQVDGLYKSLDNPSNFKHKDDWKDFNRLIIEKEGEKNSIGITDRNE